MIERRRGNLASASFAVRPRASGQKRSKHRSLRRRAALLDAGGAEGPAVLAVQLLVVGLRGARLLVLLLLVGAELGLGGLGRRGRGGGGGRSSGRRRGGRRLRERCAGADREAQNGRTDHRFTDDRLTDDRLTDDRLHHALLEVLADETYHEQIRNTSEIFDRGVRAPKRRAGARPPTKM